MNFIIYKLYLNLTLNTHMHGPIHTHAPRAQTLVVIRTFSFPSRNLWMMEARWSTVSSPLNKDTWWPSCIISTVNHLAFRRVYVRKQNPAQHPKLKQTSCVCRAHVLRVGARRGCPRGNLECGMEFFLHVLLSVTSSQPLRALASQPRNRVNKMVYDDKMRQCHNYKIRHSKSAPRMPGGLLKSLHATVWWSSYLISF